MNRILTGLLVVILVIVLFFSALNFFGNRSIVTAMKDLSSKMVGLEKKEAKDSVNINVLQKDVDGIKKHNTESDATQELLKSDLEDLKAVVDSLKIRQTNTEKKVDKCCKSCKEEISPKKIDKPKIKTLPPTVKPADPKDCDSCIVIKLDPEPKPQPKVKVQCYCIMGKKFYIFTGDITSENIKKYSLIKVPSGETRPELIGKYFVPSDKY